jgi:class 3 adenylate cyclase
VAVRGAGPGADGDTGEASRAATGLVGLDVHRAAPVAAVGYGGQVLVSETAAALVRDRLPPGAWLADLGVHRLKDLGRPERIFQLTAAGLQVYGRRPVNLRTNERRESVGPLRVPAPR